MIYLVGYNCKRAEAMGDSVHAISKTIVASTGGWHSHTEIRFVDDSGDTSFSAEFGVGAREKTISYSHKYRWDMIALPYSREQEIDGIVRAGAMLGMDYDNIGVLGLATDFDILKPDPDKIWCSKSSARIMFAVDPDFEAFMFQHGFDENISPNDLMLMSMYYYRA